MTSIRCSACEGTGLVDGGQIDPETGIYGGEDCTICHGTGIDEHADEPDYDYERKYALENGGE